MVRFAALLMIRVLGWKAYKCYYETDGLPNPRKIRLKVAFGPFFPTQ